MLLIHIYLNTLPTLQNILPEKVSHEDYLKLSKEKFQTEGPKQTSSQPFY